MSGYINLDLQYKRAMLINFHAAVIAYDLLEKMSGVAKEEWMDEIAANATEYIDTLSYEALERAVATLQEGHDGALDQWVHIEKEEFSETA